MFLVALTGWGQESDKERARQAGFDAHLVKPVPLEVLDGLLAGVARPGPAEPSRG
jgi:CheY-like chemotaxis protein